MVISLQKGNQEKEMRKKTENWLKGQMVVLYLNKVIKSQQPGHDSAFRFLCHPCVPCDWT